MMSIEFGMVGKCRLKFKDHVHTPTMPKCVFNKNIIQQESSQHYQCFMNFQ